MRFFSYRNKLRLKRLGLICAVVAGIVLLFCLGRFIYLQRFLVYTSDGVQFDYNQELSAQHLQQQPIHQEDFPLEIVDPIEGGLPTNGVDQPMKPLTGYYITTAMLQDVNAVNNALNEVETPQSLLFDVKSIYGNFYYSSSLAGTNTASADISAIDALISRLAEENQIYLIARVPAFSDSNFALANQSCGLPLSSGALWMDDNGCYWLDPQDQAVQDFLVSIAAELAELGFDEVVFDNFVMPTSSNIVYEGDRGETVAAAAQALREQLDGYAIRVSFGGASEAVAASADRVYLSTDSGADVASMVEAVASSLESPESQVVFCTASRDTRFDAYGLLRPLIEDES